MIMRETFLRVTEEILDADPDVAVVLADISAAQLAGAAQRHPDRVINVGIREQLLVSAGAGLALAGLRPIVHTFPSFLVERAFEQIKLDFSHQDVGGVLVSYGASYDMSTEGRTHQAPGDVLLMDSLPGWTIHVPGHADEARRLLLESIPGDGRVYLRLSAQTNAAPHLGVGFTRLRFGSSGGGGGGGAGVGPGVAGLRRSGRDCAVCVDYPSFRFGGSSVGGAFGCAFGGYGRALLGGDFGSLGGRGVVGCAASGEVIGGAAGCGGADLRRDR